MGAVAVARRLRRGPAMVALRAQVSILGMAAPSHDGSRSRSWLRAREVF
jgi:hypothetical protein